MMGASELAEKPSEPMKLIDLPKSVYDLISDSRIKAATAAELISVESKG